MRNFLYSLGVLAVAVSCNRGPEQVFEESRSMRNVIDLLRLSTMSQSNELPTNLYQLYAQTGRGYPYAWQKQFERFGDQAGFKNSFFEKYWFFPAGTTSQIARGEVVIMTSHSFAMPDGAFGRSLAIKKDGGYLNWQLSEPLVQKMLKEEQVKPYDLPSFPAPPPKSPEQRFSGEAPDWLLAVNRFFGSLAERTGIGIRYGVLMRNLAIVLIVVVGAGAWFSWRRTRRH